MIKDPTFNQSAATRFANDRVRAKQRTLNNPAAAQALRQQTKGTASVKRPPVGNNVSTPNLSPQPVQANVQLPTGGPQGPEAMAEGFDPKVFVENALDTIVGDIRTQQFMESPRVKDAMESIRLKNLMNADNPRYVKDPSPLIQQVINKMGMGDG